MRATCTGTACAGEPVLSRTPTNAPGTVTPDKPNPGQPKARAVLPPRVELAGDDRPGHDDDISIRDANTID